MRCISVVVTFVLIAYTTVKSSPSMEEDKAKVKPTSVGKHIKMLSSYGYGTAQM